MKAIDRLIIKAKEKCGYEQFVHGFISPSETQAGKWVASGNIWNGKKYGSERVVICGEYDSIEEAYEALCKLMVQYPSNEEVTIFQGDILE